LHAFAADCGNLPPTEDLGRHESNYLINDSSAKAVESQIRPTLQKETLDLHAAQRRRQFFNAASKKQCTRKIRNSTATIENHRQKGPPALKSAAVGQLWLVGKDCSASCYNCVDLMAQLMDARP